MRAEPPWMKVELKTPDKTRIYAMAAALKKDPDLVLGKLVRWWCWIDMHTTDEHTHMLPDSVDALVRCKGFTQAMQDVGWVVLAADDTVDVVRWGEHNGRGAKKRVQNARDVANHRANKKGKCKEDVRYETLHVPELEKEKEYNKGVGIAPLHCETPAGGVAPLLPAPPVSMQEGEDMEFSRWLAAMCSAHRSLRQSRVLALDVEQAARAAYERCPHAAEYAPLLTAYLDDRLQETRYGKKFYRPTGQRKFFEHLEDVLTHAEDWDKETKWSKKQSAPKPRKQSEPVRHDQEEAASPDEVQAMLDEMKRELQQEEVPQEVKLYPEAVALVRAEGVARYSTLQGKFHINFCIADKLIKRMQQEGIITADRERKVVEG